VIRDDGWRRWSIWEHSRTVQDLYRRRCRLEAEEMTCHAQAAELLAPRIAQGDTVLDAGCGSGYFFHALRRRAAAADYVGIDASATLIDIGRQELPAHGLDPERLRVLRIEDLDGEVDHAVCINVLTNLDNVHRPLERLLACARKTVVLRESIADTAEYRYVRDEYLDPGVDLRVHVNAYAAADLTELAESHGYRARSVADRRTGARPEIVIGHPHHWTFFIAERP
jgi:ubiquinone/menaquinone biosynthesis C-methylase UbiE